MTPIVLYGLVALAEGPDPEATPESTATLETATPQPPEASPTDLQAPVVVPGSDSVSHLNPAPLKHYMPLRMAGWILAEQAAIFTVDGYIVRPPEWTDPQWSMFEAAWTEPTPHWDNDGFFTNAMLHPFMGAHFYMTARNHGFSPAQSAVFVFLGSFTWEYIVESWFTPPVVFDLIATPMLGVPLGMALTQIKQPIRRIHKRWLRGLVMFPVDPIEATDTLLFNGPPRTTTW